MKNKFPGQTTDTVIMISPDCFQYNTETADTNAFQQATDVNEGSNHQAMQEFAAMAAELTAHGIRVITLPSRHDIATPDAVFPNNWFSVHAEENGNVTLILYPMLAGNRRAERQVDAVTSALQKLNIHIARVIDLTAFENQDLALEGTGSLVIDHNNRLAYACLSSRTSQIVLKEFANKSGYAAITFHSQDRNGMPIYHTNVMMSIGSHFAVICSASINDELERAAVLDELRHSGKEIIDITPDQMHGMAANILEVKSVTGKAKIVLSQTAYAAFTPAQLKMLEKSGDLVVVNINMIEKLGGGSARCMLAEIFY